MMEQTLVFHPAEALPKTVVVTDLPPLATKLATTDEVEEMLASDSVVAIGVSGGKDSQALAILTAAHLDRIGHRGPRVLVHADLGIVEWKESLPVCERLAAHLGWELLVVKKKVGGLMERWERRWASNVQRYAELSCVKLILPWSTPSMRFCTSEHKTDVITGELKKRYPGKEILNVVGIRRQESPGRRKQPVAKHLKKLTRTLRYRLETGGPMIRRPLRGVTWNAIIELEEEDVFQTIASSGLALHEAYTRYHTSRVSCVFCILAGVQDLRASATCEDNHPVYRRMVDLELTSTFAFQDSQWLADIAPHLLSDADRARVVLAKAAAQRREQAEARLPKHLLFEDNWPSVMPTPVEAALIAEVRQEVAQAVGLEVSCTSADAVMERYGQLLEAKALKETAQMSKKQKQRNFQ
jgi:3'-phosphoadenosine 5'-phosphosulfate sulfotransferase (PAPS reductase)/FAD synthetase